MPLRGDGRTGRTDGKTGERRERGGNGARTRQRLNTQSHSEDEITADRKTRTVAHLLQTLHINSSNVYATGTVTNRSNEQATCARRPETEAGVD